MAHFGIITPPVAGHLNPFGALGRELKRRGHRVTVFHMPDLGVLVRKQQLDFQPIGVADHPPGSLPESLSALGRLSGLQALRFTVEAIRRTTEMICRDAPASLTSAGVDALLVDQTEPAGAVVADHLQLPYITLCMALPLHREPGIPPPFTHLDYSPRRLDRLVHCAGYAVWDVMTGPIQRVLQQYRRRWGLARYPTRGASDSTLAQISQLVREFDFPRHQLPPAFHYTGPLRDERTSDSSFPWDQLNGRPLIYASMGSLQGSKFDIFRTIAAACQPLRAQLVVSHGGALTAEQVRSFPGTPLVVSYAPQQELLSRAALTITHAGLNTVLDSLSQGVPMVAIPLTYEQPGIAARLRACGAGTVVRPGRLTAQLLRREVLRVMEGQSYHASAVRVADGIRGAGGVRRAADIVEKAVQ